MLVTDKQTNEVSLVLSKVTTFNVNDSSITTIIFGSKYNLGDRNILFFILNVFKHLEFRSAEDNVTETFVVFHVSLVCGIIQGLILK